MAFCLDCEALALAELRDAALFRRNFRNQLVDLDRPDLLADAERITPDLSGLEAH